MRVAALIILILATTLPAGETIPYRLLIGDLLKKKPHPANLWVTGGSGSLPR